MMNINQVCDKCATKLGGIFPDGHLATWSEAVCDVCGEITSVTEPRDYGLNEKGESVKPISMKDVFKFLLDKMD